MNEPFRPTAAGYRLWILLAVIAAAAFALRLAAARGGLWLDEAWSAWFAHEAGNPGRALFGINHDNNHHLNSLWLQLAGWGAPPILARGLSILAGTATVVAAGLILAPRGLVAAAIAATLFAFSPILVIYGSEARGYALMLLALLVAILLVDRALASGNPPRRVAGLALASLLGMLAHLTMAFGLAALAGWVGLTLARRLPLPRAAAATLKLMGGALAGAAAVLALVLVAGIFSPAGFQIGSYTPFSVGALGDGIERMLAYSLGIVFEPGLPLLVAGAALVAAALWSIPSLRPRRGFYVLAIFALPLAVALLQLGNSGFPRYHLVTAAALLLLLAETLAAGMARRGWPRVAAALALAAFLAGSVVLDARIVADRRGDPAEAVRVMAGRAPLGAAVWPDAERNRPVLAAAAASAGYPLRVAQGPCPPARFLFRDWQHGEGPPVPIVHCGVRYAPIAQREATTLSGMAWRLYEREAANRPRE